MRNRWYSTLALILNKRLGRAILLSTILIACVGAFPTYAQDYPENLWKIIIAESVSEGESGMMAVACCFRNRLERGLSLGSSAAKRPDLDEFVKRQGNYYAELAKRIVYQVFHCNAPDVTGSADHFESSKFPEPYWAKGMRVTCKIGAHTFYDSGRR